MVGVLQVKTPIQLKMEAENSGPGSRGPTFTFATRDLVAKLDVGPRLHGPAFSQ